MPESIMNSKICNMKVLKVNPEEVFDISADNQNQSITYLKHEKNSAQNPSAEPQKLHIISLWLTMQTLKDLLFQYHQLPH